MLPSLPANILLAVGARDLCGTDKSHGSLRRVDGMGIYFVMILAVDKTHHIFDKTNLTRSIRHRSTHSRGFPESCVPDRSNALCLATDRDLFTH